MSVQIFVPPADYRVGSSAEQVAGSIRRALDAGVDGLFAGDHVSFKGGAGNDALMQLASLAPMAGDAKLMSSVYLLALRHPTVVARQCVQLDHLSGGRLILGVGIGGEDEDEWRACGVNPKTRDRRTDESLQILRSLWTEDETTFNGHHFNLSGVRLEPKPVREEGIPIQIGGRSDAALRRTARFGNGWISIWVSTRRMKEAREKIDEWAPEYDREGAGIGLGLQIWFSVGDDKSARRRLASRMRGFYQIPYENFEKYSPFGTVGRIAQFLAPYVKAGCGQFNLLPVQDSPEETIDVAVAVKEELLKITGE